LNNMVNNPNFYGQSTTGTPNQIEDGVDFPHTGIIKALSLGLGQNYVISGFNITAGTNQYTQVDVSAGVICREGKVISSGGHLASGVSDLTMGFTTANGYHLLVVDSSNNIVFRSPSAVDKVPSYNTSDIIIGVVTYKGSSTSPNYQYLTFKKAENSFSIARSASGTYTEMGTITCDTDSIDIATTNSNAAINLTPHGTGDIKLGTLTIDGDQTVGSGQNGYALIYTHSNAKAALGAIPAAYSDADAISAVQGEATLDLTGDVTIAAGKDLTVDTSTLHVDSANNRVGIGTTSPDVDLDVKTAGTTIARVASTGSHANLRFGRANSSYDAAMLFYDDMASSPALQWRIQMTNGGSDLSIRDEDGSPDGNAILVFKDAGGIDCHADIEMSAGHNLRVGNELEIEGNLNHDGPQIGFYGTTPAAQQSVGNLTPSAINPDAPANPTAADHTTTAAAVSALETKLNALIDALQLIGIIT
jgi:hypothetical protein